PQATLFPYTTLFRSAPARCDPDFDHLAGHAERVEPDQARRARAAVPRALAQRARYPRRQAGIDARAAHESAQSRGADHGPRYAQDGDLARALRRRSLES